MDCRGGGIHFGGSLFSLLFVDGNLPRKDVVPSVSGGRRDVNGYVALKRLSHGSGGHDDAGSRFFA